MSEPVNWTNDAVWEHERKLLVLRDGSCAFYVRDVIGSGWSLYRSNGKEIAAGMYASTGVAVANAGILDLRAALNGMEARV